MILGIDPGAKGAFVLMDMEGGIEWCEDMPENNVDKDEIIIRALEKTGYATTCFIEKVHAMPHDGVVSAFSFGEGYGILQGLLLARNFYVEYVLPKVWQRAAGIPKANKSLHCELASTAWPDVYFYGPRGGLKDGRADAAFIASYGLGIVRARRGKSL